VVDLEQLIFERATENAAANSVLYGLIATRCWSPVAAEGWQNDNNEAAVIFGIPDESRHFTAATVRALVDLKCYGGTAYYRDCRAVYRAFSDRFHGNCGKAHAAGTMLVCQQVTAAKNIEEPGTRYPVTIAKFEIRAE